LVSFFHLRPASFLSTLDFDCYPPTLKTRYIAWRVSTSKAALSAAGQVGASWRTRRQFGQHTKSYDGSAEKPDLLHPNRIIRAMRNCMFLVQRATV
jgi:hypothetical protein